MVDISLEIKLLRFISIYHNNSNKSFTLNIADITVVPQAIS